MSLISKSTQILKQGQSKAAPAIARCLFTTQTATTPASQNVVIVDGVRLPFAMASTIYEDEMAVDLQRLAFKGLMDKTAIDRNDIDYVISGTVIQEVKTSNIAREAAINAGLPNSIGGHTVSMVRPWYSEHRRILTRNTCFKFAYIDYYLSNFELFC